MNLLYIKAMEVFKKDAERQNREGPQDIKPHIRNQWRKNRY
ncbi:hypothetical protein [Bacillus sp. SD088]|nr:hypothetical protein [Bacillus sp. SD088]